MTHKKHKNYGFWEKTDREIYEGHGINIFGNYSWRKDLRETYRRDMEKAKTPEEEEIARLLRKQAILEHDSIDPDEVDEYFERIAEVKERIEKLKRK